MKALVYRKYGSPDVLEVKEMDKPVPKDNEVLIKVCAAAVNPLDVSFLKGKPFPIRLMGGLLKPRNTVLGADLAGRVEAVGKNVKQFKPGDEVFGDISLSGLGAFAEYTCVHEHHPIVLKPSGISFESAAAVPVAAVTALQGIRDKSRIQKGQKVLINGASGGVGSFALQIAKHFGAEVTAVCSTQNLETARSIGADHVIDYTKEDFTKSGRTYDLLIPVNGYHSLSDYKNALSPGGVCVVIGGSGAQIFESMFLAPWLSMIGGKKIVNMGMAKANKKDLLFLKELLENGSLAPVIDRSYPLEEAAKAIGYLGEGHAKGKVVINIAG